MSTINGFPVPPDELEDEVFGPEKEDDGNPDADEFLEDDEDPSCNEW